MKVAKVEWIDTCVQHKDLDMKELLLQKSGKYLDEHVSVGFLALDDKEGVVLISMMDVKDGTARVYTGIPRGCIRKVSVIHKEKYEGVIE